MKIGYARVSTGVQNLDLQLTALTQAGCKCIEEKVSGAQSNKPELKRLLDQLRQDDTVLFGNLIDWHAQLAIYLSIKKGSRNLDLEPKG